MHAFFDVESKSGIHFVQSPLVFELYIGNKPYEIDLNTCNMLLLICNIRIVYVTSTTYSQNYYFSFKLFVQFMCRDMNENVKYRQKPPERTTIVSVTLKLL